MQTVSVITWQSLFTWLSQLGYMYGVEEPMLGVSQCSAYLMKLQFFADEYRIFPIKRPRGRYILQRGGGLIETNYWQNVVFNNCVIFNK